jgi:hypothetical protein
VILPWNIATEVKQKNARLAELGTKLVTAVPKLEIHGSTHFNVISVMVPTKSD